MKKVSVAFVSNKLKEEFESLNQGKFEDKQLYSFINKAIEDMKQNPRKGIKIPRKIWPAVYAQKYDITNLWKH